MSDWQETILTLLAGGVLTILTTWLADNRLNKRERDRRQEEQAERLKLRRDEFQRVTLLDLQTATQGLSRNAGASHHQDFLAFSKSGVWGRQKLPENLSNEALQLLTTVLLLTSRVHDQEIRGLVDKLKEATTELTFAQSEAESQMCISIVGATQESLLAQTGKIIRSLD